MTDLKYQGFSSNNSPHDSVKFSEVRLDDLPLAMAYVPMQKFGEIYSESEALTRGTLFPELDKPFRGKFTGVNR